MRFQKIIISHSLIFKDNAGIPIFPPKDTFNPDFERISYKIVANVDFPFVPVTAIIFLFLKFWNS